MLALCTLAFSHIPNNRRWLIHYAKLIANADLQDYANPGANANGCSNIKVKANC